MKANRIYVQPPPTEKVRISTVRLLLGGGTIWTLIRVVSRQPETHSIVRESVTITIGHIRPEGQKVMGNKPIWTQMMGRASRPFVREVKTIKFT